MRYLLLGTFKIIKVRPCWFSPSGKDFWISHWWSQDSSVCIHDRASRMTEQMVHVSCQWSNVVALRPARRKCVGSWETLQHNPVSIWFAGGRGFLLKKRKRNMFPNYSQSAEVPSSKALRLLKNHFQKDVFNILWKRIIQPKIWFKIWTIEHILKRSQF